MTGNISHSSPVPEGGTVLTGAPQRDALLLMGLADAVVAVAIHAVAGVPVVEVDVRGTVGARPCAEFWQIAGIAGFPAWCARRL